MYLYLYLYLYIYIYMYIYIYIYIHIYTYLVRHGNVLMVFVTISIGEKAAAGNHKNDQRRKPVLKTQKTRNRSKCSKIVDPPAAAESTKSSDGNHKNISETITKT